MAGIPRPNPNAGIAAIAGVFYPNPKPIPDGPSSTENPSQGEGAGLSPLSPQSVLAWGKLPPLLPLLPQRGRNREHGEQRDASNWPFADSRGRQAARFAQFFRVFTISRN